MVTLLMVAFAAKTVAQQTGGSPSGQPSVAATGGVVQQPTAAGIYQGSSGGNQLSKYERWTLVFNGMTAIGTISVAILAVFLLPLKTWFQRPKLSLVVGDHARLAERVDEANASSPEARKRSYQLRLQVVNSGRNPARNCVAVCDEVYSEKAGGQGFFKEREFVQRKFYWTTGEQKVDVVRSLASFIRLGEISVPEQPVSGPGPKDQPAPSFSLQVNIEADGVMNRFLRVGKEKVLIPVTISADNLVRSEKYFIEICWKGHGLEDFNQANFQIQTLTEDEGRKQIGDG